MSVVPLLLLELVLELLLKTRRLLRLLRANESQAVSCQDQSEGRDYEDWYGEDSLIMASEESWEGFWKSNISGDWVIEVRDIWGE